ncbi:MAG: hypothetical protein WC326_11925 [Candidatus Delongbacteria bacterium]
MFFDLYDIFQNIRIRGAEHKADRARELAGDLDERVETLERRVAMLLMTSQALWDFIKRHHDLTDADLLAQLKEIEAEAGRPDGKAVKEAIRNCPACGKTLQKTTGTCLYCGHKADLLPFERT